MTVSFPMEAEKTGKTRILLPCGIGDVYWTLVKLQSFCTSKGITEKPHVAIITTKQAKQYEGSELRSIEFLKMIPFVNIDNPPNREAHPFPIEPKWLHNIYMEMWHGHKIVHPGFMGFDYFLVYNCAITNGIFLEKIDDLACNWHFPITVSEEQEKFRIDCINNYGKYAVYLWSFCGGGYSVEYHVKEFPPDKIAKSIIEFTKASGLTPVFIGSWWDVNHGNKYLKDMIAAVPGSIDLVGKTNLDQLFGVLKGSELVVGCHCGPTILSTAFNKKTIILWAKSYPLFAPNSPLVIAPPDARETTYWPIMTDKLTVDTFVGKMTDLYNQKFAVSCICGSHKLVEYERPIYHVIQTGESVLSGDENQQLVSCTDCGIVQQINLPFKTEKEYADFYIKYPPTTESYKAKDWDHDLQLARQRSDSYAITLGCEYRILDVGCGSGAFVHECRNRGCDAYGCEIAEYHYSQQKEFIYRKRFEDIHFPVDSFDLVTCHDVLEHTLDPILILREMFRVTKQQGQCVIDYPRFFHSTGSHHWKDNEHIWMIPEERLVEICKSVGFAVEKVEHPIESKTVIYLNKPIQTRKRILIPPGIGDSYWSVVKLESFLSINNLGIPDVTLFTADSNTKDNVHLRSVPFIKMFPFVYADTSLVLQDPRLRPIWREAYAIPGRTIFTKISGYDYFISYNGHLRVGQRLEDVDKHIICNWHPPMFVSLEQEKFRSECQNKYGSYFVCYFPQYGTYSHWSKEFNSGNVAESVNEISKSLQMLPIFAGAAWDRDNELGKQLISKVPNCVNLMGNTSVEQLFGMLRGAQFVVGYPSGLTVMSAVLGIKTLIIWNQYYNKDFAWYCTPPDTRRTNYFIDWTHGLTRERLVSEIKDLASEGFIDVLKYPSLVSGEADKETLRSLYSTPEKSVQSFPGLNQATNDDVVPDTKQDTKLSSSTVPTVMCVLKSGGAYTLEYVTKLKNMVARHSTVPYRFVCLTDTTIDPSVCESIKLRSNLPNWWSKLELFIPGLVDSEYIVYFDLDTVIVNNIDEILNLKPEFAGLGGFYPGSQRDVPENFGSGMMIWKNHGEFSFLFDEYNSAVAYRHGDQEYIINTLLKHDFKPAVLQNITSGIYSYKRNCLRGIPSDARVICFHGVPRPHMVANTVSWVRSYWR